MDILSFPAHPGSLAGARGAVRGALVREGWDEEVVELAVLAVCEALTNAVEHGSAPGDPIEVEIAAGEARAEVRVTDRGRPGSAPPVRIPAPPPLSSEHGRGLIIMRELADALEIRRAGRGTEVLLAFGPIPLPPWTRREPPVAVPA
jgi:anti-sigma regulatory factor (Ser/Thr protein kinase)